MTASATLLASLPDAGEQQFPRLAQGGLDRPAPRRRQLLEPLQEPQQHRELAQRAPQRVPVRARALADRRQREDFQPLPDRRPRDVGQPPQRAVVARDAPETYDYVARKFGKAGVEIIVDRRVGERRSRQVGPAVERRQASRRVRPSVADELQVNRWALVPTS